MRPTKINGFALVILLAISTGSGPLLGQSRSTRNSSSEQGQQLQGKPTKSKPPAKTKIDFDVFRRLKKSSDGRVYVMVTLKPLTEEAVSDQQRKSGAKKRQDELVGRMATGEFELGYRHELDPILFAAVNAAGLKMLTRDPLVQGVEYKVEARVHQKLKDRPQESVSVLVVLRLSPADQQKFDELEKAFEHSQDPKSAVSKLGALKRFIDQIRDPVLSELTPNDFSLQYASELDPAFGGQATSEGVEKLTKRADVRGIGAVPEESDRP